MNKSDLIREVHKRMNKKIALKDIDALVNSLFEVMSEKLKSGEEVQLDDFGTFASCQYCQVSRQSENKAAFDMTVETADKSLDLVFRSPNQAIKIEFQGGELQVIASGLLRQEHQ